MENLLTLTYNSTHYYLLGCKGGWLMIDAGWMSDSSLPKLKNELKRYKIALPEIRYVMMTHNHPDHAGLIQEVKRLGGARLLIHENQVPYLHELASFLSKKGTQAPVVVDRDDRVLKGSSRALLESIGIQGEILPTPGHSEDSISLITDSGRAFVGDLTLPNMAEGEREQVTRASWQSLLDLGMKTVYPAHANPFDAAFIISSLKE